MTDFQVLILSIFGFCGFAVVVKEVAATIRTVSTNRRLKK